MVAFTYARGAASIEGCSDSNAWRAENVWHVATSAERKLDAQLLAAHASDLESLASSLDPLIRNFTVASDCIPALETPRLACCDAETFWASFMVQWRIHFGPDADAPDFVCRPAWRYWRKGMTGFEAAKTLHYKVLACDI